MNIVEKCTKIMNIKGTLKLAGCIGVVTGDDY